MSRSKKNAWMVRRARTRPSTFHPSWSSLTLRVLLSLVLFTFLGPYALGQKKKDVVVWGVNTGPDSKGTQAVVAQFEKEHPEYNVRLLSMGAGGMNPQKLMTSIVGDVAPDVMYQDRFTIGDWASKNAFLPLDEYLNRDKGQADCPRPSQYYPPAWREAMYGGKTFGIPSVADDRIMYWNKAIFRDHAEELKAAGLDPDRPPRTWSELLAYSKILTEFNSDGTIKRAGYLPNFGNPWLYIYSFQMDNPKHSSSFMSADGRRCTLDNPGSEKALQFMVDGYDLLHGYENAKAFETGFLSKENDAFVVGKVAMKVDGDWILADLVRYGPNVDLGVAPAPIPDERYNLTGDFAGIDPKERYLTWIGGFCFAIPRGARNPQGGWDFIKFATSTRGRLVEHRAQREWEKHRGRSYIPRIAASREANDAIYSEFKPGDPKFAAALKLHIDMMKHSRIRPPTFEAQLLWDEQVKAIENSGLKKLSVKEALASGQASVQRELDAFFDQDKYPIVPMAIPMGGIGVLMGLLVLGAILFVRSKRAGALSREETRWAYLFISPWLIGFIVLTLGPMLASLFFSFTQYNVLTPAHWVGTKNYADMLTSDKINVVKAFTNVLYLAAVGVPFTVFTGLAVALLLNAAVRGIRIYRTMFYMPAIVPTVASAVLWIWILYSDPHRGLINGIWDGTINKWLGLSPPGWLNAESWSKPALILMGAWGAGSGMILWLAGLKGIPSSLYEASSIDGATPKQQFWSVTFPQLSPVLFFNVVIGFIGALQEFDRVYMMKPTEGATGPGESLLVPVYHLFVNGFSYFKMGYASALAWTIFALILLLTMIQFRLAKSWVHYEADA